MHDLGEGGCNHLLASICALASACLLCNTESRQSACLLTVLPAGRCLSSAYVTTLRGNTHTLLRLQLITAYPSSWQPSALHWRVTCITRSAHHRQLFSVCGAACTWRHMKHLSRRYWSKNRVKAPLVRRPA